MCAAALSGIVSTTIGLAAPARRTPRVRDSSVASPAGSNSLNTPPNRSARPPAGTMPSLLIDSPHPCLANRDPVLLLHPSHVLRPHLGIGIDPPPRLPPQVLEWHLRQHDGEAGSPGADAIIQILKP